MTSPPLIFVLNGPNLNRLGRREPDIYGRETLDEVAGRMSEKAGALGLALEIRQSNHEGHLIDWLHEAEDAKAKAVIINPGGYGHTSVALRDAVSAIETPVILVHLSDPMTREAFRRTDLIAEVACLQIKGKGVTGYLEALDEAAKL